MLESQHSQPGAKINPFLLTQQGGEREGGASLKTVDKVSSSQPWKAEFQGLQSWETERDFACALGCVRTKSDRKVTYSCFAPRMGFIFTQCFRIASPLLCSGWGQEWGFLWQSEGPTPEPGRVSQQLAHPLAVPVSSHLGVWMGKLALAFPDPPFACL